MWSNFWFSGKKRNLVWMVKVLWLAAHFIHEQGHPACENCWICLYICKFVDLLHEYFMSTDILVLIYQVLMCLFSWAQWPNMSFPSILCSHDPISKNTSANLYHLFYSHIGHPEFSDFNISLLFCVNHSALKELNSYCNTILLCDISQK